MRISKSIIFYSIFIFFNFANADSTIDSESNAPVLSNFAASPNYVDVTDGSEIVTLTIDIEEDSGTLTAYRPTIISCNGNGGGPPPSSAWQLVSGDAYDGTWEVDITIPET